MINKIKILIKRRKEKKKKGFTLVELLAVIVILAIIMVITIPTVIGSMRSSKQKAFETVGQTMKKYVQDNYNNCKLGNSSIAKYDDTLFYPDCSLKYDDDEFSKNLIKNSGYSTDDIKSVDVVIDETGDFALKIETNTNGQFKNLDNYKTTNYIEKNYSSSCWTVEEIIDGDYVGTYKLSEFHGINNDESSSDYGKVDSNCSGYVSQDKDGFYSINIPAKIEDKEITTLGNDLFCSLDSQSINLEPFERIVDVNNYQFINNIIISEGIKKLEDGESYDNFGTFYGVGYDNFTNQYNFDKVKIQLPNSLSYVGMQAFDCVPINDSLTLTKNIEFIGRDSFRHTLINKVIFEGFNDGKSKLKRIEMTAFSNNNLTYLDESDPLILPSTIEYIGNSAFSLNDNLKYIKFTGDTTDFESGWDKATWDSKITIIAK